MDAAVAGSQLLKRVGEVVATELHSLQAPASGLQLSWARGLLENNFESGRALRKPLDFYSVVRSVVPHLYAPRSIPG